MAKKFEVFPYKDKSQKPSTWWILFFAIHLLFEKVLVLFKRGLEFVKKQVSEGR
jgi:hypothetical protein